MGWVRRWGRQPRMLWAGLFLLALGVRLCAAALHPPRWDGDQQRYAALAESSARGLGWWSSGRPEVMVHPLFPVLHATVLRVLPRLDVRTAGALLALLVSSLLPLVAVRSVAVLWTPRAAWIAGLLLALQPHHVLRATALEPDLLDALLLCWAAVPLHRREWALAGSLLGLAYLDRPEAVVPAVAVCAGLYARGEGARAWVRFLLPFLALTSVFVVYVHAQTGRWALSGKDRWQYQQGVHQWRTRGAGLDPSSIPALEADVPSLYAHLREHPGEFLAGYGYRAGLVLRNVARQLGWLLLLPAISGAKRLWVERRQALFLLALPLLAFPVLALVGTFFRHAIPPAVAALALAAVGLDAWVGRPGGGAVGRGGAALP